MIVHYFSRLYPSNGNSYICVILYIKNLYDFFFLGGGGILRCQRLGKVNAWQLTIHETIKLIYR